jgi:hypothetical protein
MNMAIEQKPITAPTRFNAYTVPAEQQGWRGLGVKGENAKRRVYTLLWNEQVLVCALLLMPGERSIRHSHESGELSITFTDALHPSVGYTPGGVLHSGAPVASPKTGVSDEVVAAALAESAPGIRDLLEAMAEEQRRMQAQMEELYRSAMPPGPRMLIDILFPPFKTTIDDPAYPEPKTIVGPWYD